jgi:hypothetical protein
MKLTNFLATHRTRIRKIRRYIATGFACGCAVHAHAHDAPFGRTLLYCLALAVCAYSILCCIDRIIGIISPIVIDLSKIKNISVYQDGYHLYIENEKFSIKALERFDGRIDSFELSEKIENSVKETKSRYMAQSGESCVLFDGKKEYKLDAGLVRHLLAALNCHTEARHACSGLSFIA